MRHIAVIGAATDEERAAYKKQKEKEMVESLSDEKKQTPMFVKVQVTTGKIHVGMCPACNHCVSPRQLYCDECFQKLKWDEDK